MKRSVSGRPHENGVIRTGYPFSSGEGNIRKAVVFNHVRMDGCFAGMNADMSWGDKNDAKWIAFKEKTMAAKKKSAAGVSAAREVDAFIRKLRHPLTAEIEAVRAIILGASPEISEGIKWNSPSFRCKEYFATINTRKDVVLVILHLGAKVKDNSTAGLAISDPSGLLEWLAKDRAAVKFRDIKAIKSGQAAFENIVRQWIAYL